MHLRILFTVPSALRRSKSLFVRFKHFIHIVLRESEEGLNCKISERMDFTIGTKPRYQLLFFVHIGMCTTSEK